MEKVRARDSNRLEDWSHDFMSYENLIRRFELLNLFSHLENGGNNEILYIILPITCHTQQLLRKKKILK